MGKRILWLWLILMQVNLYGYDFVNDSSSWEAERQYLESQNVKKPFSKSSWEKAKKGLTYAEDKEVAEPKRKENISFTGFNLPPQLKYILMGFVVLGLLVAIAYIAKSSIIRWPQRLRKSNFKVLDNTEPQNGNLELHQLKLLAEQALAEKNFALAMRFVYLSAIQLLVGHKVLVWKKGIPNKAILKSIKSVEQHRLAAFLFLEFEKAHYGAVPVGSEQYSIYSDIYTAFSNTFSPTPNHAEQK